MTQRKTLTESEGKEAIKRLEDTAARILKREDKKEEKNAFATIASRLQSYRKMKISRQNTLEATQTIGEDSQLNIDLESKENLNRVKVRLKSGLHLSSTEKTELKEYNYLTLSEKKLYDYLIKKEYILHHATPSSSYEEIKASGSTLVDPQEAVRRKITMRKPTTTPYGGANNNVFFGFGTYTSTLPHFARFGTKEKYDYCVIRINYSELMKKRPDLLFGHWSSGHFYHFSLAEEHYEMDPSIPLGGKKFSWIYLLKNRYFAKKQKPLKYLIYENSSDKTVQDQKLAIKDEVASGNDILPFFCLLFIERLRYIGGEFRESLLKPPYDDRAIDRVMESVFRVDDFEIKMPTSFSLDNEFTEVITPQRRKEMTTAVRQAAEKGELKTLESLKQKHYPLSGYMYEDAYYYDGGLPATEYPILAAIKNNQIDTVKWLIKEGAIEAATSSTPTDEKFCKDIILAALETQNLKIITSLIEAGVDFNTPWDKRKKSPNHFANPFSENEASYYDFVARKIFILTAEKNKFDLIDGMKDKLSFVKKPSMNVLNDLGRYGNPTTFKYFMEAAEVKINYIDIIRSAILKNHDEGYIIFLFNELKKTKEKQQNHSSILELLWLAFGTGNLNVVNYLIKENQQTITPEMLKKSYNALINYKNLLHTFQYIVSNDAKENDPIVMQKITWLMEKDLIDYPNACNIIRVLENESLKLRQNDAINFLKKKLNIFTPQSIASHSATKEEKKEDENLFDQLIDQIELNQVEQVDLLLKKLKYPIDYSKLITVFCNHCSTLSIIKLLLSKIISIENVQYLHTLYDFSFTLENVQDAKEMWNELLQLHPNKKSHTDFIMERIFKPDLHYDTLSAYKTLELIKWMELTDPDYFNSNLINLIQQIIKAKGFKYRKMGILFDYLIKKIDVQSSKYKNLVEYAICPENFVEFLKNAIKYGEDELVSWLLQNNININLSLDDKLKQTPLEYAAILAIKNGHRTDIQKNGQRAVLGLLDAGANPNKYGKDNPLQILCACSPTFIYKKIIEALLECGAIITPAVLENCHKNNLALLQAHQEKIKHSSELKTSEAQLAPVEKSPKSMDTGISSNLDEKKDIFKSAATEPLITSTVVPSAGTPETLPASVFLVAASASWSSSHRRTGDIDYAATLQRTIEKETQRKVILIEKARNPEKILQEMKKSSPPAILHLLINPIPIGTGTLLTPADLKKFKAEGIKIVITAIDFAKYDKLSKHNVQQQTITSYLKMADQVIFLDEFDKHSAIQFADTSLQQKLSGAKIIPVPSSVPNKLLEEEKRGKNIISFGMIRKGKGLIHVTKLATLLNTNLADELKNTKILIVGTVTAAKDPKNDRTLAKILVAMYPSFESQIWQQINLVQFYNETLKQQKSVLPIELHLNVPAQDLPKLFNQCTYSFLPAYRGATLRNTSISSSLANGFITYSHITATTPTCLKPGEQYGEAIVSTKDAQYASYAETVLSDILAREKNPELNLKTKETAKKLIEEQLTDKIIAQSHDQVYSTVSPFTKEPFLSLKEKEREKDSEVSVIQQQPFSPEQTSMEPSVGERESDDLESLPSEQKDDSSKQLSKETIKNITQKYVISKGFFRWVISTSDESKNIIYSINPLSKEQFEEHSRFYKTDFHEKQKNKKITIAQNDTERYDLAKKYILSNLNRTFAKTLFNEIFSNDKDVIDAYKKQNECDQEKWWKKLFK